LPLPAAAKLKDPLPAALRNQYGLIDNGCDHKHSLPSDSAVLQVARRRLVFDEFFYLQLGLLQRQHKARHIHTSVVLASTGQLIDEFHQLLPFKLTGAQQKGD